jgi:predicted nucleic acid-binding protein
MKESYTLLDANVIIALLIEKIHYIKKAVEEITKLNNNTNFAIISPILTESYSVLVRRCIERKINCKEAILSLKEIEEVSSFYHLIKTF